MGEGRLARLLPDWIDPCQLAGRFGFGLRPFFSTTTVTIAASHLLQVR